MPVTYGKIRRQSDWDESQDTEGYIYIRAYCTISISGSDLNETVDHTVSSPGLYGIYDDGTTPEYLTEVYENERATLLAMLKELGATEKV